MGKSWRRNCVRGFWSNNCKNEIISEKNSQTEIIFITVVLEFHWHWFQFICESFKSKMMLNISCWMKYFAANKRKVLCRFGIQLPWVSFTARSLFFQRNFPIENWRKMELWTFKLLWIERLHRFTLTYNGWNHDHFLIIPWFLISCFAVAAFHYHHVTVEKSMCDLRGRNQWKPNSKFIWVQISAHSKLSHLFPTISPFHFQAVS